MTRYIDEHKEEFGVEPICRVLQFAPATYYAAASRPPSARRVRDEELKPEALRVWQENRRVYGADKLWTQLRREGFGVARCTVERLMRESGIAGTVRGKVVGGQKSICTAWLDFCPPTCALRRARSAADGRSAGVMAKKPRSKWPASGEISASKRHVHAS